jgi:hypothetical protein
LNSMAEPSYADLLCEVRDLPFGLDVDLWRDGQEGFNAVHRPSIG